MSKCRQCPICGGEGISREKRMNGNDSCANGHSYPSVNPVLSEDELRERIEESLFHESVGDDTRKDFNRIVNNLVKAIKGDK